MALSRSSRGRSLDGILAPVADRLIPGFAAKQRRALGLLAASAVAGTDLAHCPPDIRRDLAPKFYPILSSLRRFLVAAFGAVTAGRGAEPFRLRSTASRVDG